ncbi:acetyltransferase [Vibrio cholerae]|nr:acetyltransferase [Vibrio cholerae]
MVTVVVVEFSVMRCQPLRRALAAILVVMYKGIKCKKEKNMKMGSLPFVLLVMI